MTLDDCADLEISLHPRDDLSYRVDMRFTQPGSDADVAALDRPAFARFDAGQLLALQARPGDYGRALANSLFADEAVRSAFLRARTAAASQHAPLRLRLVIPTDAPDLHGLLWETLRDPEADAPLLTDEHVRFSRYLASRDWSPVQPQPRGSLRALAAVANPADLHAYGLAQLDVTEELARPQRPGA